MKKKVTGVDVVIGPSGWNPLSRLASGMALLFVALVVVICGKCNVTKICTLTMEDFE